MSGSLNRVMLIGNLGQDPEIKTFSDGGRVANLSIATSETWRDKQSGERKERVEWHRVNVWGDGLVGVIEKYCRKGDKLYIEGQLQTRKWQDQQGNDRYSTEVVVRGFGSGIKLLSSRRDGASGQSQARNDEPDHYQDDRDHDFEQGGGGGQSGGGRMGVGPGDYKGPSTPRRGEGSRGYDKTLDDEIPFAPEVR